MLIEVRPVQPEKTDFPIVVTLAGMLIDVSPTQPLKALSLMLVTEFGMVTDVNPVLFANAELAIVVTL